MNTVVLIPMDRDDDLVQMAGCTCLALLCKESAIRLEVEQQATHQRIFRVIQEQKFDVDTQKAAFKALFRLCFSSTYVNPNFPTSLPSKTLLLASRPRV